MQTVVDTSNPVGPTAILDVIAHDLRNSIRVISFSATGSLFVVNVGLMLLQFSIFG